MNKQDLTLNNLQCLICHKNKPKQTKTLSHENRPRLLNYFDFIFY